MISCRSFSPSRKEAAWVVPVPVVLLGRRLQWEGTLPTSAGVQRMSVGSYGTRLPSATPRRPTRAWQHHTPWRAAAIPQLHRQCKEVSAAPDTTSSPEEEEVRASGGS